MAAAWGRISINMMSFWCKVWAGAAGRSARCAMPTPNCCRMTTWRLLAAFEPTEEWVLEPGDILYVPPRAAA